MDQTDFSLIDPRAIRVRISLNEPAELEAKDVKLVLQFNYSGDAEKSHLEYLFLLKPFATRKIAAKKSWFSNAPEKSQYEFLIAETSVREFRKYQREFFKYGRPDKYKWTVFYYLKTRPEEDKGLDLDLELKLSLEEDYFYLLQGAELDIND